MIFLLKILSFLFLSIRTFLKKLKPNEQTFKNFFAQKLIVTSFSCERFQITITVHLLLLLFCPQMHKMAKLEQRPAVKFKNKRFKKWIKALTFYRGMKSLEKAAFSATYKTVWCAGPSIEHVKEIRNIKEIVTNLTSKT